MKINFKLDINVDKVIYEGNSINNANANLSGSMEIKPEELKDALNTLKTYINTSLKKTEIREENEKRRIDTSLEKGKMYHKTERQRISANKKKD